MTRWVGRKLVRPTFIVFLKNSLMGNLILDKKEIMIEFKERVIIEAKSGNTYEICCKVRHMKNGL